MIDIASNMIGGVTMQCYYLFAWEKNLKLPENSGLSLFNLFNMPIMLLKTVMSASSFSLAAL